MLFTTATHTPLLAEASTRLLVVYNRRCPLPTSVAVYTPCLLQGGVTVRAQIQRVPKVMIDDGLSMVPGTGEWPIG